MNYLSLVQLFSKIEIIKSSDGSESPCQEKRCLNKEDGLKVSVPAYPKVLGEDWHVTEQGWRQRETGRRRRLRG